MKTTAHTVKEKVAEKPKKKCKKKFWLVILLIGIALIIIYGVMSFFCGFTLGACMK